MLLRPTSGQEWLFALRPGHQEWLLAIRQGQDEPPPAAPAENETYRNWGFRVYRTYYGPSSDQKWEDIIQRMRESVKGALAMLDGVKDDAQILSELFHLDLRSDAATLDGLNLDQIRQIHQSSTDLDNTICHKEAFLVADQDVLEDDNTWIKCVEADYVAPNHVPFSPRHFGPRYFGWMKMTTGSVADLWFVLEILYRELSVFAPRTIGGMHLVIWDGTSY